jgi:hypothetical protein
MKKNDTFKVTASTEEPQTAEDWQMAADAAEGWLKIKSAVDYGLVKLNLQLNVERCEQLLQSAAERGITPHTDALERLVAELQHQVRTAIE